MPADLTELALEFGTRLLGLENLARLALGRSLNELERHVLPCSRVRGQDDQRHAAATKLPEDLVRAQPMEDRAHGPAWRQEPVLRRQLDADRLIQDREDVGTHTEKDVPLKDRHSPLFDGERGRRVR